MENKKLIINKKKVMISVLFLPLAIPIFGLMYTLSQSGDSESFFEGFLGFTFIGLLYGAIVWIPAVIFCLLLELIVISPKSTKMTVYLAFLAEALLAWLFIYSAFGFTFFVEGSAFLGLAIILTQAIRLLFLTRKNKMYIQNAAEVQSDTILDDL